MLEHSKLMLYCIRQLGRRWHHHEHRISRMFPQPRGGDNMRGDAGCKSQKLMLQHQLLLSASPGGFYLMPHTVRALEKLHRIIDKELQTIGAQKVALPILAPAQIWKKSERWDEMGSELFQVTDRNDAAYCLAPTHEEAITTMVASESPVSHKRLPIKLYQIGKKFRDEMRPKNGLLRCREFEMKDLYIFDKDEENAQISYNQVCKAYENIFALLGVPYLKVSASSGAMGGSQSDEFHLLAQIGEDSLLQCENCGKSFNQELEDDIHCTEASCHKEFTRLSGIEVAHAFLLGTRYSKTFNALYVNQAQKRQPLYMGCYGIGVTRLLSAALEVLSSDKEIRWPKFLAPYQLCIVPQKEGYQSDITSSIADNLYTTLPQCDEILMDDRLQLSIGRRINYACQLGIPYVVVVGKQALKEQPLFELIDVYDNKHSRMCNKDELVQFMSQLKTVPL